MIFAVQNRDGVIRKSWKEKLYKYMIGSIRNHDHKVLAINGIPDHVHI
nr:transposase [Rhodonellum psychrophilum]